MKKYITVDNYKEFKPSDFVESFISDIDVAEKLGKPMNMADWYGNGCLPCLGGMACMNMKIDPINDEVGYEVSDLGDGIRNGSDWKIQKSIEALFKIKIPENILKPKPEIRGKIDTAKKFDKLRQRVIYYADILRKEGF